MLKKSIAILVLIMSILVSCSNSDNKDNGNIQDEPKQIVMDQSYKEGLEIFSTNCINCHSPRRNGKNQRVAPPIKAIKRHYLGAETTEDQFVSEMTDFLLNPSEDKSKMPGALKKFGIMPNLGMSEEQYRAVANYLFRSDVEDPNWYETKYLPEKAKLVDNKEINYLKQGGKFAMATKAVLGKNLLGAIKSKGTEHALGFCNERAIVITDSMSHNLNAKIKRVSDKNRNPSNKASKRELAYINQAKKAIENGKSADPQMIEDAEKVVAYYPIITNKMCMQCHGEPNEEIKPKSLEIIKELYPNDMATGYKPNELRGIWVIEMDKQ